MSSKKTVQPFEPVSGWELERKIGIRVRVTRLGKFLTKGRLFTLDSNVKITDFGLLFTQ
jgi:hypothetical protein